MPATNERAPAGSYVCENCGESSEHPTDNAPMPPCPHCGVWTLYRRADAMPAGSTKNGQTVQK